MKKSKNFKVTACVFLMMIVLGSGFSVPVFADTIVTTGTDYAYFHSSSNPVAQIFYFVGDLLALPFKFVGNLID